MRTEPVLWIAVGLLAALMSLETAPLSAPWNYLIKAAAVGLAALLVRAQVMPTSEAKDAVRTALNTIPPPQAEVKARVDAIVKEAGK